jgi:hypothetical protein
MTEAHPIPKINAISSNIQRLTKELIKEDNGDMYFDRLPQDVYGNFLNLLVA